LGHPTGPLWLISGTSETRIRGGTTVSRIRYVSDTDTPGIRRGYVSNLYRRIGLYWAWKLKIGYVSEWRDTAQPTTQPYLPRPRCPEPPTHAASLPGDAGTPQPCSPASDEPPPPLARDEPPSLLAGRQRRGSRLQPRGSKLQRTRRQPQPRKPPTAAPTACAPPRPCEPAARAPAAAPFWWWKKDRTDI